jgi:preprotein translocase subunit SecY
VSQPLEAFRNSFKIPELKQRIIFTLLMLAVYRFGAHVPTPGIDGRALADVMANTAGGLLGMYDLFTGGAFANATIFALGIMPYISASIIMQLLVAVVPALEKLQKEGSEGQKKITEYTRYGTIALGIVQSIGIAIYLQNLSANSPQDFVMYDGLAFYFICVLSFTTGTAFIMWLGEQISEFGVGNGISLLIFVSIISAVPATLASIGRLYDANELSIFKILFLIAGMVVVVAGAILITTAQRRIPVQYPRQVKGKKVYQGARNYLPLRVNQAGVIPIIFASSILMLPSMVFGAVAFAPVQNFFNQYFQMDDVLYNIVYAILIIFFCFFYTAITFNPVEMADNLKKYGGVIMGVRPGKQTAEYLNKVMTRITFVGSIFLAGVALIPQVVYSFLEVYDWQIASFFGGTSLLILVGVGLDTVRQIETHLVMRNYEGFMKGRRMRGRRI